MNLRFKILIISFSLRFNPLQRKRLSSQGPEAYHLKVVLATADKAHIKKEIREMFFPINEESCKVP